MHPVSATALLLTAASLAAPFAATSEPAATVAPRPNILWLIAEDLSPDLACYGHPLVATPHLDRLAADGMRFTRAFTTAPVCSASRSAFMTGMYQTSIDAHHHRSHRDDGHPLPAGVRLVTDWLREAGYFTANVVTLPAPLDFKGSGKTDWNFAYDGKPFDTDRWTDLKERQPFYAQINFSETHRELSLVRETGRAYPAPRRIDPARVKLPPYYPDTPEIRADWANYLDDVEALDRKIGAVLAQLERDGLANNTIVLFIGDHGASHVRSKQWCYDSGLRIPLLIRWPKGIPPPVGFQTGAVSNRLIEAIDLGPTALDWAGVTPPAAMQGRSFLGAHAAAPRHYAFAARDRCDETVFRIRTVRDGRYRYIRNFMSERPFFQTNRYKENLYPAVAIMRRLHEEGKLAPVQEALFAPTRPPEELYDLENDPYEIHNLASEKSPEVTALLTRFRTALDVWLDQTNDLGRIPEAPAIIKFWDDRAIRYYDPNRKFTDGG